MKDFLNGPKLYAWLCQHVELDQPRVQLGGLYFSVRDWKLGRQATVWKLDEVLIRLGLGPHLLDEIPDEIWEPPIDRLPKSPQVRRIALEQLSESGSVLVAARRAGVSPQSVRRWSKQEKEKEKCAS